MPFFVDDMRHWRERATQARALAENIADPEQKKAMFDIAVAYDRMAERAEARDNKRKNSN